MVKKRKSAVMMPASPCWLRTCGGASTREGASGRVSRRDGVLYSTDKEVIYVRPTAPPPTPPPGALRCRPLSAAAAAATKWSCETDIEKADNVIDLGAPPRRLFRRASEGQPAPRRSLTPNPRLYPGPKPKPKPRPRRAESKRARRGKYKLRPVPNSRLYRPGPPRIQPPSPPPARPRTRWPPPPPACAPLDTASNVALRRLRCATSKPPARSTSPRSPSLSPGLRNQHAIVVTLPSAGTPRYHYQPASEHFRARQSSTANASSPLPAARLRQADMDSASPEDRSEGNETLSAPSEFLAEFLSAIMRRQYAEALKYCRLILQYEPHNATAQSFYPLLRQKLRAPPSPAPSPSPERSPSPAPSPSPPARSLPALDSDEEPPPPAAPPEDMDRGSSEDDDQSDLELDSSQESSPSFSFSHHTTRTGYSTSGSAAGCSGGAGSWDRSGSGGGERSASAPPPDDNGNPPAQGTPCARPRLTADDLENDNASAGGEPHQSLKSDSVSSLRRLRAQFACSIK